MQSQSVGYYWVTFMSLSQVLVAASRIFSGREQILGCGMWDVVPWPGVKPRPPCIGELWVLATGPPWKSLQLIDFEPQFPHRCAVSRYMKCGWRQAHWARRRGVGGTLCFPQERGVVIGHAWSCPAVSVLLTWVGDWPVLVCQRWPWLDGMRKKAAVIFSHAQWVLSYKYRPLSCSFLLEIPSLRHMQRCHHCSW